MMMLIVSFHDDSTQGANKSGRVFLVRDARVELVMSCFCFFSQGVRGFGSGRRAGGVEGNPLFGGRRHAAIGDS